MSLIRMLEEQGVQLEPKLSFKSVAPLDAETVTLLKTHKAELLRDLVTAPQESVKESLGNLPRLPWQLERLLSAAASDVLRVELPGVPDVARYVLAWGCTYLTGDRDEALKRLWQVHSAWQQRVN